MNVLAIFLSVLSAAAAAFSFFWFKKTNPGLMLWWLRTPTSHALAFGTITFGLIGLDLPYSFLEYAYQFAGALLLITGFGFTGGAHLVHRWTRQRLPEGRDIALLIYGVHLGAGAFGAYLLFQGRVHEQLLIPALGAALAYLLLIGVGFIRQPHRASS